MDHPGGGADEARHAFHERGFPRTIVTGEGDALARLDGKCQVIEKDAGTKLNAKGLNGNHLARKMHARAPGSTPESGNKSRRAR
jgi:hypothetical protein